MPDYVVSKVVFALNSRKIATNGSRVLVLGLAYKKNVDDPRESPSAVIMDKLRALGAEVAYSDPHIPSFPKMRNHHYDLESVPLTADNLRAYDCILLSTDHDRFDYDLIKSHASLIVDARGRFDRKHENIVSA